MRIIVKWLKSRALSARLNRVFIILTLDVDNDNHQAPSIDCHGNPGMAPEETTRC